MQLYVSGTPSNDRFQAVENQMCRNRLFSLHGDYQREVFRWLQDVKAGVRTFRDYCEQNRGILRTCEHDDRIARRLLKERGFVEDWPTYVAALTEVSDRLPAVYPKRIMLDSGAFSAWNKGAPVTLNDVRTVYARFLEDADGLFDEIWLINLDVIPGEKGRDPSSEELRRAFGQSDENLAVLQAEFGDRVLPVFHQDEGKERLLEVIDQARGYMCLSPLNTLPEDARWRWTALARCALSDLDCNVRTHGLATTGNEMLRNATLFSGDSEAWKRHARYGVVDLLEDEATLAECPTTRWTRGADGIDQIVDRYLSIEESPRPRYRGYHISAERNDWNRVTGDRLIDSAENFELLSPEKRTKVRKKVEKHVDFLLAQFDMRARSLVNIAELQKFAESFNWREPTGATITVRINGKLIDPEPYYGKNVEVRPYPISENRKRFMAHKDFESL